MFCGKLNYYVYKCIRWHKCDCNCAKAFTRKNLADTFLGGFHKTLYFFLRPFFIAIELFFILFIYRLEQFVVCVRHLRKYWSFNKAFLMIISPAIRQLQVSPRQIRLQTWLADWEGTGRGTIWSQWWVEKELHFCSYYKQSFPERCLIFFRWRELWSKQWWGRLALQVLHLPGIL